MYHRLQRLSMIVCLTAGFLLAGGLLLAFAQEPEDETPPAPYRAISAASSSGSHTWDSDADFLPGVWKDEYIEVTTDSVRLLRRWTTNVMVNDSASDYPINPTVTTDNNGNVFVAWSDARNGNFDIYFSRSTDGGDNWNTDIKVNDDIGSAYQDGSSLVVDNNGNLYLAWFDDRNGNRDVYFAHSTDGGNSWSSNIKINDDTGTTLQAGVNLAVGANNHVYAVWVDGRNGTGDIYFSYSTDGGNSWSSNAKVNDDSGTQRSSPTIVVDANSNIYVAWPDGRNGYYDSMLFRNYDIYFAHSIDDGNSWSADVRINDDTGMADQFNPNLAVDSSGIIHATWGDDRNGNGDIYFAKSTDGGYHWSTNIRVNDDTGSNSQGTSSLALDGSGNLYVAWQDGRNNNSDIYFSRSINGGDSWNVNLKINDDIEAAYQDDPSLTVDDSGNLYAAWLDRRNNFSPTTTINDIYFAHWPGTTYYTEGDYLSRLLDAGDVVAWDALDWTATFPAGTAITMAVRVGNTDTVDIHWSDWHTLTTTAPADLSDLHPSRYLQWRASFASPISTTTPILEDVTVAWNGFDYTAVSGSLGIDTAWPVSGSPYLLTGPVAVGMGATLTVEPGVEVWFRDGADLRVFGGLVALGTAAQPVTFTSWHVRDWPDDWGGIAFADTAIDATFDANGNYQGGSVFQHATVEYGGGGAFNYVVDAFQTALYVDHVAMRHNSATALRLDGDGSYVGDSRFSDNNSAIHNSADSTIIRNNIFSGTTSIQAALYHSGADGLIEENVIEQIGGTALKSEGGSGLIRSNRLANNGQGIRISDGSGLEVSYNTIISHTGIGIKIDSGYPTVRYNTFGGNSGHDLYNDNPLTTDRVDARYNWWASPDEAFVKGEIFDWWDDTAKGVVDYKPYLLEKPDKKPLGLYLDGEPTGEVGTAHQFEVSVYPNTTLTPVTYTWQATGLSSQSHSSDSLEDQVTLTWPAAGEKTISVTVSNAEGSVQTTRVISIAPGAIDQYEPDGDCASARSIPTDGTVQRRTIHVAGDEDWVSFQAIAGAEYIVEAIIPEKSQADVALKIYDSCGGAVQDGQSNSFSPDISLTFTAPSNGQYYLRLVDDRATAASLSAAATGSEAAYQLSVRSLAASPPGGAVIIVAGKRRHNDPLQTNIDYAARSVYNLFQANGYSGDTIHVLSHDTALDLDGDGTPDVDRIATAANLREAIINWAPTQAGPGDPVTLYMVDHGGYDLFYLNAIGPNQIPETVSAYELDSWLDTLETALPGLKLNIIVEACQSGSFIDLAQSISQPGRVVIASTGAYPLAYASQRGATFSDALVGALGRRMSLFSSFQEAKWAVAQAHPHQTPWLDDNGNGVPNEPDDGLVAAGRSFAYAGTLIDPLLWPPHIEWAGVDQAEGQIRASLQVPSEKVISQTWALIYPPSYEPPQSEEEMVQVNVPQVDLADPDGDGVYEAAYNFTESGQYRVVVYAVDNLGLNARPRQAKAGLGAEEIYLPMILK